MLVFISTSSEWLCRVVVLVEVVDVWRVTILDEDVSSPEGEKATDEQADGTDINREIDCERGGSGLAVDTMLVGAGQCSLTEPPDSKPLGSEVAVGEPVATQGQTLGVTKVEVSRWVPLQGTGALSTVAVISGADWVEVGSSALLPLTLPPFEIIDCHEPDISP